MASRRTARDWSDTRAVSAIAEPTGADVTIIDRTARITPRTHTHDLVREETTDLRVVARRRPEPKSRVGRRHGPPVLNAANLSKGAR